VRKTKSRVTHSDPYEAPASIPNFAIMTKITYY